MASTKLGSLMIQQGNGNRSLGKRQKGKKIRSSKITSSHFIMLERFTGALSDP